MAKSVNKVTLIGNVGKDPELRFTQSGKPVANFTMATTKVWKAESGEKQEKTTWHRLVTFGGTAEFVKEYVHKGSLLYVEGELQSRSYDDRDGKKVYVTEIVVNDISLLDKRKSVNGEAAEGIPNEVIPPASTDDDVPF